MSFLAQGKTYFFPFLFLEQAKTWFSLFLFLEPSKTLFCPFPKIGSFSIFRLCKEVAKLEIYPECVVANEFSTLKDFQKNQKKFGFFSKKKIPFKSLRKCEGRGGCLEIV